MKKPRPLKLVGSNGRLTPEYWVLKEAFVQGYRPPVHGTRGVNCYRDQRAMFRLTLMVNAGWLTHESNHTGWGARGGSIWRCTGEGAFMLLVAEGINAAMKAKHETETNRAARAKEKERSRRRRANTKIQTAGSPEQKTSIAA